MRRRILTAEDAALLLGAKPKLRYKRFTIFRSESGWSCERGHQEIPDDALEGYTVFAENADEALFRAKRESDR